MWIEKIPLTIRIGLALGWYAVIFFITEAPEASSDHTLEAVRDAGGEEWMNGLLRVSAHLFVFGIQGLLVYALFAPHFEYQKQAFRLSVSIVILLAIGDEVHQSFVEGRYGRPIDVIYDSIGASIAILGTTKYLKRWKRPLFDIFQ